MTGLEKILEHIAAEADKNANALLKEAQEQAEEVIRQARVEAQQKVEVLQAKNQEAIAACLKRGESAALLQEKRMILQTKQALIEEMMEKAKASLYTLSDEAYFEVILKMISKYALNEAGEIVFSAHDRERMPKAFDEAIGSLKLSEQTRAIDGGFVLIYGEIEENCSFEALFLASKEVLQDKVCQLLFV